MKHNHLLTPLQVQRLLADIHWLQQQVDTRHSRHDGTHEKSGVARKNKSGDEAGRLVTTAAGGRPDGAVGWGGRVMGDGGAGMVAMSHRGLVDQMSLKTAGTDTCMHAPDAAGYRLHIHPLMQHARTHALSPKPEALSPKP